MLVYPPTDCNGECNMSPIQLNQTIHGIGEANSPNPSRKASNNTDAFAQTLNSEITRHADVKLSAHAAKRLAERNVHFGDSEQARLTAAVDRIEQKGADKSLVLMDDLALLVSARNRTVITAMDSASAKDGVFTNIDSAVII